MENVTIVYPGKKWIGATTPLLPPLSALPLAGVLEREGYKPGILDMRLEDYRKIDVENQICVGISAMTGSQIKFGLKAAKYVREKDPEIPIVWGGIHPTLLPDQTLADPLVDIVVRGEGELTLLDLVRTLEKGGKLEEVQGLSYREDGKMVNTPDRPFMNLDETYDLPYHLLKSLKEYHPEKVFYYTDGRGCPHRCTYCYNSAFCRSTWRTKSTSKILDELTWAVETFKPEALDFKEDNFFVSKKRIEEICRGMVERGFDVTWHADCRVDYFRRFDKDFMDLIVKSGCHGLNLGGESGSQRVLDFVKKDITVEETTDAIKKCREYGIQNLLFWIVGVPTETREEMLQTLKMVDLAYQLNPNSSSIVTLFSPYPGTPLFSYLGERYEMKIPKSLEGWGKWTVSTAENAFWLDYKYAKQLEYIAICSRLISHNPTLKKEIGPLVKEILKTPFSTLSKLRWRKRYFGLPVDMAIWRQMQEVRGYF